MCEARLLVEGPLTGTVSAQKAPHGSETKANKVLLEGTKAKEKVLRMGGVIE